MSTNAEKIKTQLETKKSQLERIAHSNSPTNPNLESAHARRVENSKTFLKELDDLIYLLDTDIVIYLVSKTTLKKKVDTADFATIDFDGEFCKLALIQNFPYPNVYMLYVPPVNSI